MNVDLYVELVIYVIKFKGFYRIDMGNNLIWFKIWMKID